MKVPGFGGWNSDPLWARFYDWTVEHERVGGVLWRAGVGSELRLLYDAAAEIGRQPPDARILDIPCGGGVALRGLRPGQGVEYVAADIAQAMLDRTASAALERGVADQVKPQIADVGALPFGDGEFDLVVSFTGLHCFPDPHRAITEIVRVLRPGGVLTGSTLLNNAGLRYAPIRPLGRAIDILGPGLTYGELAAWLAEAGLGHITIHRSGALAYFRGTRR